MRILLLLLFATSAFSAPVAEIREVTKKSYAAGIDTNAVVVFDVSWGRKWNCGGYENAELMSIAFDRFTGEVRTDDAKPDLVVVGPARLTRTPRFLNYGFLLPPGQYALSGFRIKVARSVSDVGYLTAKRSDLIKAGKAEGGTFTVAAGEIVYIGNFFLDCLNGPVLWRYYSEGKKGFEAQVAEYRAKYAFTELARFKYRLFKSTLFGTDYELPE
jgi:hypothetical protein